MENSKQQKNIDSITDKKVPLVEHLNQLHKICYHNKIVDIILELPKEESNSYEIKSFLARAYNNLNQYDKAIDILTELKEQGKDDYMFYYRLGYSHYYMKNYDKASDCFENALILNPKDADAWLFIANIYSNNLQDDEKLNNALENLKILDFEMYSDFIRYTSQDELDYEEETLEFDPDKIHSNTIKFPSDYVFCSDMHNDQYYPNHLVKKIQDMFLELTEWLSSNTLSYGQIQDKMDYITRSINDLEDEFYEQESEIETVARESIGETVFYIFDYYKIDIDIEHAIREREW